MTQALQKPHVLEQRGKVFTGSDNPKKGSRVPIIYRNAKGTPVCSALIAQGTRICETTAILSSGRCKKHGGMSPVGVASAAFKTGRHSRHLPSRLVERYEEALADPEMHSLEAEIALIDARIADLQEQLDSGGGGEIFKMIDEAYRSFSYASQDGDKKMMRESLRRLDEAVVLGRGESDIWNEIHKLQEGRRKMVLSEAKRLQMTNQMVTVTRVNLLISALLAAVREEVSDRNVLGRISEKFLRITRGENN